MRVLRASSLVLGLALLTACGDNPGATALTDVDVALDQGVAPPQARGDGDLDLTSAGAAFGFADLNFKAKDKGDGRFQGTFRMIRRSSAGALIDFTADVTCLAVDVVNRRAWIGGVITKNQSDDPASMTAIHEPGQDVWFRVVDYGEGATATQADRSTVLGFRGGAGILTSAEYCATKPWRAGDAGTFPMSKGVIRIKP